MSDIEWSPGTPPNLDLKKIETLKRRLSTEWKDRDDDTVRDLKEQVEHKSFLISNPALEEECPKCVYLQRIVEYRLIGKLADSPIPEPPQKRQPSAEEVEAKKRRRLKRIESDLVRLQNEAEKLRDELGNSGER